MQATPAHDRHNPDLLRMMPACARRVIEVGCSTGALARAYKQRTPGCHYLGVEQVADYAEQAREHCDVCLVLDIERAPEDFWQQQVGADCWVFGDTLEHLGNPWQVLRRIRGGMPPQGALVLCVPNAQHWSLQARLAAGVLRYEDSGLLDRTHLRWFTRQTLLEMLEQTGFRVEQLQARIFAEPARESFLPLIAGMARAAGGDAQQALRDALPLQYVLRAVPA